MLGVKFVIRSSLNIPPHLKLVATLPCELFGTSLTPWPMTRYFAQQFSYCATVYFLRCYHAVPTYTLLISSTFIVKLIVKKCKIVASCDKITTVRNNDVVSRFFFYFNGLPIRRCETPEFAATLEMTSRQDCARFTYWHYTLHNTMCRFISSKKCVIYSGSSIGSWWRNLPALKDRKLFSDKYQIPDLFHFLFKSFSLSFNIKTDAHSHDQTPF